MSVVLISTGIQFPNSTVQTVAVPDPTGYTGLFLTNNGSSLSWAASGGFASTDDNTSNATYYPVMATTAGGATAKTSSLSLTFNPLTGTLSADIFNSLSDENKKTNITLIKNPAEIVAGLNGVTFDWIDSGLPSAGLIAQDVEKFLPQLVTTEADGHKTLNYNGVIGVLVEAIKAQQQQINALTEQVSQLLG